MGTSSQVITKQRVQHVAKLAKLEISDQEATVFAKQLEAIIHHIEQLDEVDTQACSPTFQVIDGRVNVFREDVVQPSLSQKEALSQAAQTHEGYFVVLAILDQ